MKKYTLISIISILLILASCEKFEFEDRADTFFHVKVNQTELPVWVKGKTLNKKLVIYINGGPGLTSIDLAETDLLGWSDILEDELAMVYYDQRGCGNAQGNILRESLTVSQFASDLDAIINVLKHHYEGAEIYLMSHSFGSFIASTYLMDTSRQSKISGWISVDGAFNFDYDLQWKYRRDFLVNIANEEISGGKDTGHWTDALTWASQTQEIISEKQKEQWRDYIGWPGEIILPEEEGNVPFGKILRIGFSSSYNILPAYFSKNLEIVNDSLNADVEGMNHISEVSNILLPSLFIWGRYDDLVPPELGYDVFNNLGTPENEKDFLLMEESGHEPYLSQPKTFQNSIVSFVNQGD